MRKLMSMVGAVEDLIEADRAKLYCVDSFDAGSWSADHLPLEERARRHAGYESWIFDVVVPHIRADTGDSVGIATAGCSMGAFHALNFALKRADLFPLALCCSSWPPRASATSWTCGAMTCPTTGRRRAPNWPTTSPDSAEPRDPGSAPRGVPPTPAWQPRRCLSSPTARAPDVR